MKKSLLVLCSTLALSGCMFGFDPDVDSTAQTREEHHTAYRKEFGCPLTDDHELYRNCLINTYKNTHPKTYATEVDENGKSVAIVKNETKTSYDKETDTYKTERVIVIETEERLVPVPAPVVATVPPETMKPVEPEPACDSNVAADAWDDEIIGVIEAPPLPEQKPTVVKQTPPPPPAKPEQETWWNTYKKDKELAPAPRKPVCPCPDPNDPCPQCVDK